MTTPAQALQNAGWTIAAGFDGTAQATRANLRAVIKASGPTTLRIWYAYILLGTQEIGRGQDADPFAALTIATANARTYIERNRKELTIKLVYDPATSSISIIGADWCIHVIHAGEYRVASGFRLADGWPMPHGGIGRGLTDQEAIDRMLSAMSEICDIGDMGHAGETLRGQVTQ